MPRSAAAATQAASDPAATPATAVRTARVSIKPTTSPPLAPIAIRTPISRVDCATNWGTAPKTPTSVSRTAAAAKSFRYTIHQSNLTKS
jgi:hypothetical protein